ncbi:YfzA family protein [Lysinibacillus sp. NPDC096418]|uniref:YfzA family protein n=1 Tax=Lysinibacillus sp. NPDC096418 TaxID=3364138 RepID=UPI0037F11B22
MEDTVRKSHSIQTHNWKSPLGAFLILQLSFFLIDISPWAPRFRDFDGKIFGRLLDSKLITEWVTLYDIPEFNLFTAFFAVTLLPYALINAIKAIFSKTQI